MPVERFASGGIYEDEVGYSRVVVASGLWRAHRLDRGDDRHGQRRRRPPRGRTRAGSGRLPGRVVRPRAGRVLPHGHRPDPDVRGRCGGQCRRRGSGALRSSSVPSARSRPWSASAPWSMPRCSSRSRSSPGDPTTTRRPERPGPRRRARPSGCRACGRVGPHDEGGTPCRTRRPTGSRRIRGGRQPPEPTWWPWPETQADEPTGPRDGAPGVDETLSLPVEDAGRRCRRPSRAPDAEPARGPEVAGARARDAEPAPTAEPSPSRTSRT